MYLLHWKEKNLKFKLEAKKREKRKSSSFFDRWLVCPKISAESTPRKLFFLI
jgi:hypothetical protein